MALKSFMRRIPLESYDNLIRGSGNFLLESYNWITGGTKSDLIKKTSVAIPIFNGIAAAYSSANNNMRHPESAINPFLMGILIGGVWSILSYVRLPLQKRILEGEEKVRGEPFKDIGAENAKKSKARFVIPANSLISALFYKTAIINGDYIQLVAGLEPYILEDVILCADDFPPRKNVFKRAKDKLVDMVNQYRETRALAGAVPALANPSYRKQLGID